MNSVIIYGSHYGTTKRYAEKFSEVTKILVANYKKIKNLSEYNLIIHFGGLYAGGVKGLKNTDSIRKSISRQVPENILKNTAVFHLRGGIDYEKLNFKHRTMMTLLYNKAKNLPEDKKTAEVRAMIDTYNSKVDFVDYSSLNHIMDYVQKISV